jgi:hypothetical protein
LKEALSNGIQTAVAQLGQTNGFLNNAAVKIPLPEKLQSVAKLLHSMKQDYLINNFVNTMNHAAEQAVPAATSVFAGALQNMSIDDANRVLTGGDNAATQYFRNATETNLFTRFLPIVTNATQQAGVTASYKKIMDAVGAKKSSGGFLGGVTKTLSATGYLNQDTMDIDSYVTQKALDGLFTMIAEQEKKIRENPVARTTETMQQVFGAVTNATNAVTK